MRHTSLRWEAGTSFCLLLLAMGFSSLISALQADLGDVQILVLPALHQIILLLPTAQEKPSFLERLRRFPLLSAQLECFLGGRGRFLMVLHLGMCRSATLGAK